MTTNTSLLSRFRSLFNWSSTESSSTSSSNTRDSLSETDEKTSAVMQPFFGHNGSFTEAEATQIALEASSKVDREEQMLLSRDSVGTLFNIGNTCWMNSLIQFLKFSPLFVEKIEEKSKKDITAHTLLKIIRLSEEKPSQNRTLQQINEDLLGQLEFFRASLEKGFQLNAQHDPSDALQYLLNALDIEPDTLTQQTYLQSADSLIDLLPAPMPLSQIQFSNPEIRSIQEGIKKEFMSSSFQSGDEKVRFNNDEPVDAYKIDYLIDNGTTLPKEMVIQAPRFDIQIEFGEKQIKKNINPIHFNEEIFIPLYDQKGEKILNVLKMRLQSIIAHSNGDQDQISSGHYVTYKKVEDGFIVYNDSESLQKISNESAHRRISKEGYLANYVFEKTVHLQESPISFSTKNEVLPSFDTKTDEEDQISSDESLSGLKRELSREFSLTETEDDEWLALSENEEVKEEISRRDLIYSNWNSAPFTEQDQENIDELRALGLRI